MSYSTIQYVKPPAKIGTPGSARTLSTEGPPATASLKGPAEMQTAPLVKPGKSAVAERPATGNHQERQQQQECLPHSGCKQQR
jgi:hypothetical protein